MGPNTPPTLAEYTRSLYSKPELPHALPWQPLRDSHLEITDDDIVKALKTLASGKAIGVDGLSDLVLKRTLGRSWHLRRKVRFVFSNWLNGVEEIPQYLRTARTMFLSKDGTEFPEEGNVRIISMLCATIKLWEHILHEKLK